MDYRNEVEEQFRRRFNETPCIVRSPGRINLIGEHTDYNDGFVLPGAIDKAIYFAVTPRNDNTISLVALDVNEVSQFNVESIVPTGTWQKYILGVVDQLQKRGISVGGFNCVFGGNIPIGAGLSSSAAVEVGIGFALNTIFDFGISKSELATIAQHAEHEFVGVKCGIMDQYANIYGEKNSVLKIDCRSLTHTIYPMNPNVKIMLFNTGVSHNLASSEYNKRRAECTEGVKILRRWYPQITHLRDGTPEILEQHRSAFDSIVYRRCLYVTEENIRVEKACLALKQNDLRTLGQLLYESHEGLSKKYEVSCAELDFLVDTVRLFPEVYGGRLMGGGFGGCTINLVNSEAVQEVSLFIEKKYEERFSRKLTTYIVSLSDGTSVEQLA
ncbi:MAG TPA: galactokinase [Bacteroidota bacterium]|nr:galactokinase [Bacteroidota bacterium]